METRHHPISFKLEGLESLRVTRATEERSESPLAMPNRHHSESLLPCGSVLTSSRTARSHRVASSVSFKPFVIPKVVKASHELFPHPQATCKREKRRLPLLPEPRSIPRNLLLDKLCY